MQKRIPTVRNLCNVAKDFCDQESKKWHTDLFGITDGKAIGTYVEHLFESYLSNKFDIRKGNSAAGLDLPQLNTDIKVTSLKQPQSSCPYRNSEQKIYGLGYNLIIFVYVKEDNIVTKKGRLHFVSCTFIEAQRTGDYQITRGLREMLQNNANVEDVFAYLNDKMIPGDEITLMNLAEKIVKYPPLQGYLTISNALQWRLQYGRLVTLNEVVEGIISIVKYEC